MGKLDRGAWVGAWMVHGCMVVKIRQIPLFAIQKIITDSWIIRVWTYQKGPRVILLESESNTGLPLHKKVTAAITKTLENLQETFWL